MSPRKPQNVGGPYGPGSLTSSLNLKEEEREREREPTGPPLQVDSFSLGSDMPGTETEDEAFGLTRRRRTTNTIDVGAPTAWTTLVGITASQAQPHITESLEADIQALGEPTQRPAPEADGGNGENDNLPPTLPWTEEWQTQRGGSHQDDLGDVYQSGGSSESSESSHRRRRLHAAGLN